MNKLGKILGQDYEAHRMSILTRTFTFGEATIKVKVPNVSQIEKIYNHFKNPDKVAIEAIYQDLIKNIDQEEKVEKTDNDILVDGRSMRETAKNTYLTQYRILEYFKFLVPQEGQDIETLTYDDIANEMPLAIQMEFVDKINEVISPNYKDIKSK